MNTLLALVKVVAAWCLLWGICCGLGLLVRRLFGRRPDSADDLRLAPWVGWAAMVVFLQVWHLRQPVNDAALGIVAALGVAGLLAHRRWLTGLVAARRKVTLLVAALFLATAYWLANHAVMQPGVYDSGLYHLNGVRWAREYAIVPGLGNLHGRLAYNNSSFLYGALMDAGPFTHRAHHVASGFLILLLLVPCLCSAARVLRRPAGAPAADVFEALAVAPLVVWAVNSGYTSSLSPDVPCFVLAILLGAELLRMLAARALPAAGCEPFASLCLLAMTGITVKLSFAAYAVAAGVTAFAVQWLRVPDVRRRIGMLTVGAALTLVVIAPWCARGVLLSGYPAYPATIGRCPVDWAVAAGSARIMVERIQSWARIPDVPPETVLHTWSWLGPWFRRTLQANAFDFTAPLVIAALALGVLAWRTLRGGRPWRDWRWLALLPAVAGDLVWFFAAPDPRYQGATLWVLGLVLLALALPAGGRRVAWVTGLQALLVLGLFVRPLDVVRTWKDPGPAKRVPMVERVTNSGLRVLVPAQGDQAWDSDLPATPYFTAHLRLREPGRMAQGFTRQPASAPAAQPEDDTP